MSGDNNSCGSENHAWAGHYDAINRTTELDKVWSEQSTGHNKEAKQKNMNEGKNQSNSGWAHSVDKKQATKNREAGTPQCAHSSQKILRFNYHSLCRILWGWDNQFMTKFRVLGTFDGCEINKQDTKLGNKGSSTKYLLTWCYKDTTWLRE